jgi:hypothetical protein
MRREGERLRKRQSEVDPCAGERTQSGDLDCALLEIHLLSSQEKQNANPRNPVEPKTVRTNAMQDVSKYKFAATQLFVCRR